MALPLLLAAEADASDGAARADTTDQDRRMAWWREAKLGMFVHWGLYAVSAGTWKGEQIPGLSSWTMHRARIPIAEYEPLARELNPVKFDAREWVRLAEQAGMKYLVITSKHHDGFCMFDSKVTEYDVVDATPYGRDPMKELAAACNEAGIRFGFYYSQRLDWHHPDAMGNTWDFPDESKQDFRRYLDGCVKPHLRELLTNYGPIALIWFDMGTPTAEQAQELKDLIRDLQPDTIISGRIGHRLGDYRSMGDNRIPPVRVAVDWETPATINDTWGFKSYDHNWKGSDDLIRKLVDIVSKGGNYLLNVGPTAEGVIPRPSAARLRAVGKWLRANGESIYGAGPSPFRGLPWGRCTTKPGRLFLHVFEWPERELQVRRLHSDVTKAYLLARPKRSRLKVARREDGVAIELPTKAPDPVDTVVVLEIEEEPEVDTSLRQAADGTIHLHARDAMVHGKTARYQLQRGMDDIGYWTDPTDWVSWDVTIERPGAFSVEITYSCSDRTPGSTYTLTIGEQALTGRIGATGGWTEYVKQTLGNVTLARPGPCTVSVKPQKMPGYAVMDLQAITLRPIK
ncbi:MAG: alpha-L-fucosidase [Armatimonadota bacterium]|jgi:alpha-L-fucosidase